MDFFREPQPQWTVRLFRGSSQRWPVPNAPCMFHRLMQRLFLGICWERLK